LNLSRAPCWSHSRSRRIHLATSSVSTATAPEWKALLHCCSFAEHDNSTRAADGILPEAFVALAEAHGVTGLLAKKSWAVQSAPALGSWSEFLRGIHRRHIFLSMALIAEMFRVLEALHGARVTAAIVKGPGLSVRAFGDPSVRQYGDVDFVLHSCEIEPAFDALTAAGFRCGISAGGLGKGKNPGQYTFRRTEGGSLIELHTERTLRYFPRPLPIKEVLRRRTTVRIDGRIVPVLSAEDEFVLISVHGAKHFWERLMWIADVAALAAGDPQMDWSRVREIAADVGAERMVRVALLLAERTLQAPIPAELRAEIKSDPVSLRIVRKIESWLPYAGQEPPALLERALFRLRTRGRLISGAGYLTRLSLTATEEDWVADADSPAVSLRESLRRPFRLARKYRRNGKPARDD